MTAWLALSTLEHKAFLTVADEIAQIRKKAAKKRR